MKTLVLILALLICSYTDAQNLPHGTTYGHKPGTAGLIPASKLENFMGKRTRISVSIAGVITNVIKTKGGWFNIDGGRGKSIVAHFKNTGISIPMDLKGHRVIVEGVAEKQFNADDKQHYAGNNDKANSKKPAAGSINFEVTGLKVE